MGKVKYDKENGVSLDTFSSQANLTEKVDEPERMQWGHKAEFMLACIGYAVGLGNVWRFPYLCQSNGGGAFLIPYFIMLLVEGIPLFYMELSIGQRMRLGPIPVWKKISPWSGGVGYGMCVASFLSSCFYNVIIAWCLYYLVHSFQSPLPWESCHSAVNSTDWVKCKEMGSTQYYWYYEALNIGSDINDRSGFTWKITLCLLLAWVLVIICMWKGIQTTGKVVYFTATFPYLVLLVFLVQGFMLEGYDDGLKFFFVPKWEKLKEPKVWLEAAAQIFFSLSLAFGGLIAYASYNDEKNNTLQDALIISFTNCATSILAGTVIFSILGYRANSKMKFCMQELGITDKRYLPQNCTVEHFLNGGTGGTGLAFVAFTEAISQLPVSTAFSLLFFLMLITLGMGSMFGSLEGLVTSLRDMPMFKQVRKEFIIIMVAIPGFLSGLGFTLVSGEYMVQLFNKFSVDIPILVVALCEIIFISWVYGMDRFSDDIEYMTGRQPPLIFKILWRFISPATIFVILVLSLYGMMAETPLYELFNRTTGLVTKVPYPGWALGLGIFVFILSFLFVPIGIVYNFIKRRRDNYSME